MSVATAGGGMGGDDNNNGGNEKKTRKESDSPYGSPLKSDSQGSKGKRKLKEPPLLTYAKNKSLKYMAEQSQSPTESSGEYFQYPGGRRFRSKNPNYPSAPPDGGEVKIQVESSDEEMFEDSDEDIDEDNNDTDTDGEEGQRKLPRAPVTFARRFRSKNVKYPAGLRDPDLEEAQDNNNNNVIEGGGDAESNNDLSSDSDDSSD